MREWGGGRRVNIPGRSARSITVNNPALLLWRDRPIDIRGG